MLALILYYGKNPFSTPQIGSLSDFLLDFESRWCTSDPKRGPRHKYHSIIMSLYLILVTFGLVRQKPKFIRIFFRRNIFVNFARSDNRLNYPYVD